MRTATELRPAATALLLLAVAVLALVVAVGWARLALDGALLRFGLGLAFAALGAIAALHRPLGGRTLGVGAALAPPLAMVAGAAAAGWAAGAALLVADLAHGGLARRWLETPNGSPAAGVTAAARTALATLAAGLLWSGLAPAGSAAATAPDLGLARAAAAAAAVYAVAALLLDAAADRLAGGRWRWPGRRRVAPYALDLGGWALGAGLAAVGRGLGGSLS